MITPDISHYHGRVVENVAAVGDGWHVVLEGDVRIVNLDPNFQMPGPELVGMKLSSSIFSASETRLWFGTDENPYAAQMYLNPTGYAISDANYEGGLQYRPQSAEDEQPLTAVEPSAPGERIVEGPEQGWDDRDDEDEGEGQ